jgi:hypothetical protein
MSAFGSASASAPAERDEHEESRVRTQSFASLSDSRFREELGETEKPSAGPGAGGSREVPATKPATLFGWSWRLQPKAAAPASRDPEKEAGSGKAGERKLVMLGPLYAGCGAGLAGCKCCCGCSSCVNTERASQTLFSPV